MFSTSYVKHAAVLLVAAVTFTWLSTKLIEWDDTRGLTESERELNKRVEERQRAKRRSK